MSKIFLRVASRGAHRLKHRVARALRLDSPHMMPLAAAAVYRFRMEHRRALPVGVPTAQESPLAVGNMAEVYIERAFPRTLCFIKVDAETQAIRWTYEMFVSLHLVGDVTLVEHKRSYAFTSAFATLQRMSRTSRSAGSPNISAEADRSGRKRKLSTSQAAIHVKYSDRGGVQRVLELKMLRAKAVGWAEGLQELLDAIPRWASAAHWRWALSCMAATSIRGATGFVSRSELSAVLRCANARARLTVTELSEAMQRVEDTEVFRRRHSVTPAEANAGARNGSRRQLLTLPQISQLLIEMASASPELAEVFSQYQIDGRVGLGGWN
eukprot:2315555-Prymnesium_polylepis.1